MKQFEKIKLPAIKKSVFDLSHERKISFNMGELIPVMCQEVIPGDKFRVNMEHLIRFMPILAPMMHRVNVYTHFFFVPNRIIWKDWEEFITGGKDGNAIVNHPKITGTYHQWQDYMGMGTLADHLGVPIPNVSVGNDTTAPPISQLPFRAYQAIWNNYYMDHDLETEVPVPTDSIDKNVVDFQQMLLIKQRAWEKDYFTSARPTAQRGNPVKIPMINDGAIVQGKPIFNPLPTGGDENVTFVDGTGYLQGSDTGEKTLLAGSLQTDVIQNDATVRDLSTAYALQRWLERTMRGGYRYVEQLLTFFNVISSDSRLQRPEYLGGGKSPLQVSEVLQLSQTDITAQGNMAGHALSVGQGHGFTKFFEEHGYVIGIISVLPRTAYSQGLPKHFFKFDRFDYFWPDFAHIGEQPVLNKELYLDAELDDGEPVNDQTFGYQPRYTEYRYMNDTVHGSFRDTLDYWHMSRKFVTRPALNGAFVQSDPTGRIFAVADPSDKVLAQLYFDFKAIRPVPKYGNPI